MYEISSIVLVCLSFFMHMYVNILVIIIRLFENHLTCKQNHSTFTFYGWL